MLHVFLMILKIIGLILGAAAGLVLLILCLVLLVPVRYRGRVSRRGALTAEAKVTWLFHLVSLPVSFRDGVLKAGLKVLGFTVLKFTEDESGLQDEFRYAFEEEAEEEAPWNMDRPETGNAEEPSWKQTETEGTQQPEQPVQSVRKEVREQPSHTEQREKTRTADPEKSGRLYGTRKKGSFFSDFVRFLRLLLKNILAFPGKIKNLKCTIRRFCVKIKRIRKKYRDTRAFVLDDRTKAAVSLVMKQARILLRQALPRKIEGELHFGTGDPSWTGRILGGISIFYPAFKDNVKVYPDFEQTVLEGELAVKGRLRLITAALIAFRLFRDRNVRYVYGKWNRMAG